MSWRLIHADCIEAMAAMDEASVDAIVCDPPYGLEFMGKEWDRLGDVRQPGDPTFHKSGAGPFDRATVRYGYDVDVTAMQRWHHGWATEALRVLKPGAHLLAFGGTRTYHRLACALEDAGFEIRDCLAWLYGSGFPKSLDVSKAIDKAAGAERTERVGVKPGHEGFEGRDNMKALREGTLSGRDGANGYERPWMHDPEAVERQHWQYAPATPEAERWQGWGTALKPAFEPIVLARKPLVGSVATNVERFGTGALNIDGTRIEMSEADAETIRNAGGFMQAGWAKPATPVYNANSAEHPMPTVDAEPHPAGRWPANVVLDPEAAALLDAQTGERVSGGRRGGETRVDDLAGPYGGFTQGQDTPHTTFGDTGGSSRFFKTVEDEPCELHGIRRCTICLRFRYVPKADREERDRGLEGFAVKPSPTESYAGMKGVNLTRADLGENRVEPGRNPHPTVKPVELMRWLCRLITPPGGTVLDPFTGSGSTGIAALREGFDFIGIEREADYVEIARARIQGDAPLWNIPSEVTA